MKRLLVFFSVVLFLGIAPTLPQMGVGSSALNIGASLIPGVGLTATYDYGLVDSWGPGLFTIGGVVGFNTWTHSNYYTSKYRKTRWAFAPRATYRYSFFPNFEAYASFMLGVGYTHYSKLYDDGLYLFVGATAGCRYSFSPNIAVFAELGYMTSVINAGVSISL